MDLYKKVMATLESEELLEALSEVEHERWSHWQRYMHAQCTPRDDGALVIPAELVRQWSRQMSTAYHDLSAQEKESDRDQVRRYLPTIRAALHKSFRS